MQDDVKTFSHDRMTLIMYIWSDGSQPSSICLVSPPSYRKVWGLGAEHGQMGQSCVQTMPCTLRPTRQRCRSRHRHTAPKTDGLKQTQSARAQRPARRSHLASGLAVSLTAEAFVSTEHSPCARVQDNKTQKAKTDQVNSEKTKQQHRQHGLSSKTAVQLCHPKTTSKNSVSS